MKTIYFATSNKGKFAEAKEKFKEAGFKLKRKPVDLLEIQDDDLVKISKISAAPLARVFKKPFFVEDAGFFISALNGFPGPYTKYAHYHIRPKGILKLMRGVKNRSAYFMSAIVFRDGSREKVFKGICRGNVAHSAQGAKGFGFDPIFAPEGERKTFASDMFLKQRVSHRSLALKQLIKYLSTNYDNR